MPWHALCVCIVLHVHVCLAHWCGLTGEHSKLEVQELASYMDEQALAKWCFLLPAI
jgi:hypothetical protein